MIISEEDYPVIATMRNLGCSWAEIAVTFGVSYGTMRNRAVDIMSEYTEGSEITTSSFGKSRLIYMALRGTRDDGVMLSASKALVDLPVDDQGSTVATVVVDIKADILKELR